MNKSSFLTLCFLLTSIVSFGQGTFDILAEGNEFYQNLQYQKAIEAYSQAYEKTNGDEALRGLIKSHLELGIQYQFNGNATGSQTNFSQGLILAERLVAGNASNDENRLLRGLLYVYNGQYENARTDYEYVKLLYPENGRVYYYLWTLEPAEGLAKIEHPYVRQALTLEPNLFELHQELGSYYSSLGMADQAISSFEKALEISPKNYKANFSLGQVYWSTGNLEKMRHHFTESIKYFPDFGYGQMMLGGVELMSGNTTEAVTLIKTALKNNPATEAYLPMYRENYPILNNYNFRVKDEGNKNPIDADGFPRYYQDALALAQAHDYYVARDKFHQCLDAYQNYAQNQPTWTISILSWLSHCNLELGYYADAIHTTKEALALSIKHNITTDQASLAAHIGIIYFGWGDYPSAIKYGKQSIDYLLKNQQKEQLFDAYINLGTQYRKWERFDSAIYYHQLAIQQSKDQSLERQAMAYQEISLSYNANSQLKLAQEHIKLMFKAAKSQDSGRQDVMYNLAAAKVNYKIGDYKKAYDHCMLAADHFIEMQHITPYDPKIIDFASTYSGILANVEQIPLAQNNLQSINLNLVNQITYNFPAMNDQGKLLFYREASLHFERFNSFAFTHAEIDQMVLKQMLENQLLKKGLLFNDASKFHRMMTKNENKETNKLYDQLVSNKNMVARSVSMSKSELENRNINLRVLQSEIDSLQIVINQSDLGPNISNIYEENLIKKIHKELAPNEAAIEIIKFRAYDFRFGGHFTDKSYYVALIQKGSSQNIEYALLADGQFMDGKGYQAYVNGITYEVQDDKSYNSYWAPIQEKLKGINKVYFAGDGIFHKINLNTLYNPHTQKFLIDELDIRLVTSTRDIIKETPKLPRAGQIYLIGFPSYETDSKQKPITESKQFQPFTSRSFTSLDYLAPLPGTYTEVKTIEKLLVDTRWNTTVLTGNAALEENVKSITNPTVLHIATHGYFEESSKNDNPLLYSGLFLSGATTNYKNKNFTGEDGILTAYEAMHLDLQETQMVVLSACETGMGRIENGEGVYGLQRAFLIAGANSVVMSMWKVNDQTTMELMSNFYAILSDSKDKHIAFRQAQLELKEKHPNPKYWGAFNIVGK